MDYSLFKYLKLSGANSTTSLVLLSMILFLIILISLMAFALFKQMKKSYSFRKNKSISRVKKIKPEGF